MAYYDILSSSDDEDILRVVDRRPKRLKPRIEYFDDLDDIDFKMRFRLSKQSVLLVLNYIEADLEFPNER